MSETTEMGPAAAQRVAVGAQVRAARESMGLTQKAAAERIGVSNTTINNIEKGKAGQAAKLKMVLDFFNLHACPWPWQSPHWWPREVPAGGQVEVPTLCSCRP